MVLISCETMPLEKDCIYCHQTYSSKSNLNKHVKRIHNATAAAGEKVPLTTGDKILTSLRASLGHEPNYYQVFCLTADKLKQRNRELAELKNKFSRGDDDEGEQDGGGIDGSESQSTESDIFNDDDDIKKSKTRNKKSSRVKSRRSKSDEDDNDNSDGGSSSQISNKKPIKSDTYVFWDDDDRKRKHKTNRIVNKKKFKERKESSSYSSSSDDGDQTITITKDIIRFVNELENVSHFTTRQKTQFIMSCTPQEIRYLIKMLDYILSSNTTITPSELEELRRNKKLIFKLVAPKTSVKDQRRILQTGRILDLIITYALPYLKH